MIYCPGLLGDGFNMVPTGRLRSQGFPSSWSTVLQCAQAADAELGAVRAVFLTGRAWELQTIISFELGLFIKQTPPSSNKSSLLKINSWHH